MTRLRRSRLLPRLLWLVSRTTAPLSANLAGRSTALLWFTPWQRGEPDDAALLPGARQHRIEVAGHQVDVHEAGAGPTVLLVHGWADHAGSLRPLASALTEAGLHVIAVDLPSHGRTPGVRADVFINAAVVGALVERYAPRAVVAHSLGSAAAALALRDGPSSVRQVVLLAPAVRLESAVRRFLVELRLPAGVEPGLRRRIEARFGPEVWTEVATDGNLVASGLPGLVIHDEEDRRAPIEEARQLATAWPGGELITTRGLGHTRLLADPGVVGHVVDAVRSDPAATEHAAAL